MARTARLGIVLAVPFLLLASMGTAAGTTLQGIGGHVYGGCSDIEVWAYDSTGALAGFDQVDSISRYYEMTFASVDPNGYKVKFIPNCLGYQLEWYDNTDAGSALAVYAGNTSVDATLESTIISGQVSGCIDAVVSAYALGDLDNPVASDQTDGSGNYVLNLDPGEYTLRVKGWKTGVVPGRDAFAFTPPAGAQKLSADALIDLDELPQSK